MSEDLKLDPYTQAYLDHLRRVDPSPPKPADPAPSFQYEKEVKNIREKTSAGPSMVTPAMIKTELEDPYLANVGWMAFNILWYTGYSPRQLKEGLDLLIHNKPNDNRVTQLWPILIFDIK
eukprot:10931942-Ditylum_brightwellii.AAC.1